MTGLKYFAFVLWAGLLVIWWVLFGCVCLCLLAGFSSLAWFDLSGTVKNSVLCYLVFCIFSVRKVCASWLQRRIAVAFLNVLDVVKAAPQARPKTT